jgi:hypothetical protein
MCSISSSGIIGSLTSVVSLLIINNKIFEAKTYYKKRQRLQAKNISSLFYLSKSQFHLQNTLLPDKPKNLWLNMDVL